MSRGQEVLPCVELDDLGEDGGFLSATREAHVRPLIDKSGLSSQASIDQEEVIGSWK